MKAGNVAESNQWLALFREILSISVMSVYLKESNQWSLFSGVKQLVAAAAVSLGRGGWRGMAAKLAYQ